MLNWLKWKIARKEMLTLERYRMACNSADRRVCWLRAELDAWLISRPVSDLAPPPNTGAKKGYPDCRVEEAPQGVGADSAVVCGSRCQTARSAHLRQSMVSSRTVISGKVKTPRQLGHCPPIRSNTA